MMKNQHIIGLDLVRVLAIILVLSVHFFWNTKFYFTNLIGINMMLQSIIKNFCLSCVPLFLILSGYLNQRQSYNKYFFKKLLTLIIIYLFYSAVTFIICEKYDEFNFFDFIYNVMTFKVIPYSWYILYYIILYLLSPIINITFKNFSDNSKKLFIIVLFLFGIVINFLCENLYFLTYYVIGKYIFYKKPNINKRLLLFLLILNQIFTFYYQFFWHIDYNTSTIFTQSIILFLLTYNINIRNKCLKNIVSYIASVAFDIYLVSFLVDKIIYGLLFNKFNFYDIPQQEIFYYMPIVVCIIFMICFILSLFRKKIIKVR